jgi:hypothetical protein
MHESSAAESSPRRVDQAGLRRGGLIRAVLVDAVEVVVCAWMSARHVESPPAHMLAPEHGAFDVTLGGLPGYEPMAHGHPVPRLALR